MLYREVKASRILNPTSIDLGEYVINPYMGCELNCLYCYVRSNKAVSKKPEPWGSYVEIRANAPELLEKELSHKKPRCVLLGSTTECFQPVEKQALISKKLLEILNSHGVYYYILTRSPIATDYAGILNKGFCKKIYFTINNIPDRLRSVLEPNSAAYPERLEAISALRKAGVPVTPYFSPVLPWLSDVRAVFEQLDGIPAVEFEGLNFRLGNISEVIKTIISSYPNLRDRYERLLKDRVFYNAYWEEVKKAIKTESIRTRKNHDIFIHGFNSYFDNKYL